VPGLTIVTPVSEPLGDYEAITRVMAVSGNAVRIVVSGELPVPSLLAPFWGGKTARAVVTRTVRTIDLRDARTMKIAFTDRDGEMAAGTTAIGPSVGFLNELKRTGAAPLTIVTMRRWFGFWPHEYKVSGTVRRVEADPVPFTVMVNGERATLPAIHVRGRLGRDEAASEYEAYYLDGPMPITLKATGKWATTLVVSISFPTDSMGRTVERSLIQERHARVYGIFFSFASDTIRAESEPVLREIADALDRHPDWRIRLEGHTDSIGGPAANQELSLRRVEAVKQELVGRFGIDRRRLSTAGYGASRPIDTNDTPEGRARNRRVELTLE
jgi:outer membrane protein OmpA-like peptidoglycan-associated protein